METGFFVGSNRGSMLDPANDRDHLPGAGTLTSAHQRDQQLAADSLALGPARHIDRILHRVAIGGSGSIRGGVGETGNSAVEFRDQVRQVGIPYPAQPGPHLLYFRRLNFERSHPFQDFLRVYRTNLLEVGLAHRSDQTCWHASGSSLQGGESSDYHEAKK